MCSPNEGYVIRPLRAVKEFYACEELQRLAWEMGDELVVPAHMLLTTAKTGGLLLGAFDAQDQMIGFVMGILALREGPTSGTASTDRLKHHSHMLGVHPDFWGQGIGYRLKLAQREAVLAQGLDLITWTFDPLERRNATLNFAKLGTVCDTYRIDLYGVMDDSLNVGLPSDRFEVAWQLRSPRVQARLAGGAARPEVNALLAQGAQLLNPATRDQNGLPHPSETPAEPQGKRLLVEVPADFQALKRADMALASAWRRTTREIFVSAFDQNYLATDFLHRQGHSYYLLENLP